MRKKAIGRKYIGTLCKKMPPVQGNLVNKNVITIIYAIPLEHTPLDTKHEDIASFNSTQSFLKNSLSHRLRTIVLRKPNISLFFAKGKAHVLGFSVIKF